MTDHPGQLHLPITLIREPTLEDYRAGPNAEALAAVEALVSGAGEPYVFLFGGASTGKTHLLQGACQAAIKRARTAQYIPLGEAGLMPSIFDDLETRDLLAIDDVQAIAGKADWEVALFDLFNRARARGCALLIAGSSAPDALGLGLADLCSRLQWGPRYCLLPLADPDCERLLTEVATELGMRMGQETARYIMNNYARDPGSLVALIERIDQVSLREQRQPTIPLVRRVMRGES
ncbi:DnaA regulatory inactivator Hda [Thiocapsa roseopersicina]|uniref:Regulatory inactivation of DnaA Hda protein n=1 Tax=Thiocapsa roseopersicina TaxID=1058 RepID=A0A1H2VUR0_THIRO|nr:DnaA regulatory inactivator Hda [Thiocapsa roseopersicina]SDW72088.1 regulatory inactivation of DnaA Hda protein [Thiocapsa roseopersicina]